MATNSGRHNGAAKWTSALALAILATSCGGSTPESTPATPLVVEQPTTSTSTAPPTTAPTTVTTTTLAPTTSSANPTPVDARPAEHLVWATEAPPNDPLDPSVAVSRGHHALHAQVFDHLTDLDDRGWPIASLATFSQNATATEWTFELRDDVRWHDGTPLTASDVLHTFSRITPDTVGATPWQVSIVDDLTVRVVLETPDAMFAIRVSSGFPETAIVQNGTRVFDTPVGTGPFKVDNLTSSGVSLIANDDWWGGTTTTATLDFVFLDTEAMLPALLGGEIDGFSRVGPPPFADPGDFSNLRVIRSASNNHRQVWMRTDVGPFSDVNVREALSLTLNRGSLTDALGGYADASADDLIGPTSFATSVRAEVPDPDISAASRLLRRAGYPTGLSADLHVVGTQDVPTLGLMISEQAAAAGFDLNVITYDPSDFYLDIWCPDFNEGTCREAPDIGIIDYGHRALPEEVMFEALSSSGAWNSSNFANPAYEELLKSYRNATSLDDASARLGEISDLLQDELPVLVPYTMDVLTIHAGHLYGVAADDFGRADLHSVTTTALEDQPT